MMNIAHYTIVSDIDYCTIVSVHIRRPSIYSYLSICILFGRATIRLCALLVGLLRVELCIAVFNYLVVFREGYHGLLTRCSNHRRIREQGADGPWEPEATESPSTGRSPQAGSGRTSASSRSRNPIAPRSKAYSPKFA